MIAFLFPGQGSESPRMGLDVSRSSAPARALLALASRATGVELEQLLERGGRELTLTEILQPAIVAVSLGALGELARLGLRPDFVAGHSLGEVAAFSAAGALGPEGAIEVAAARGKSMACAAQLRPGGMIAVEAADEAAVEPMLRLGRQRGALTLAAHNAPDEWVLSGDRAALTAVAAAFRAKRVPTHGAWHSSAMQAAVDEVHDAVRLRLIGALRVPTVTNRDGQLAPSSTDVPRTLAEQLVRPIRWAATLATLASAGVTEWVTVGPGKVLRALIRRNLGTTARIYGTEDAADLARTVEALCHE